MMKTTRDFRSHDLRAPVLGLTIPEAVLLNADEVIE
jgi:hypothetical protein